MPSNEIYSYSKESFSFKAGIQFDLKPFQQQSLEYLENGTSCLLVAPTGSGKSLCYQSFASRHGFTLVISPLISLVRSQQHSCHSLGLKSAAFHHQVSFEEKKNALQEIEAGGTKVLFTTPESLKSKTLTAFLQRVDTKLIVIDEAHCVSDWGFGFRPDYRKIGNHIKNIFHSIPPILALSATVSGADEAKIKKQIFGFDVPSIKIEPIRKNIKMVFNRYSSVIDQQHSVLESISDSGQTIVYASTIKLANSIHRSIQAKHKDSYVYHGQLNSQQKSAIESAFNTGQCSVLVTTKAFSLGIHVDDVRQVIHAGLPMNIEQYLQESGRAGRDGKSAKSFVFYTSRDIHMARYMLDRSYPNPELVADVYKTIDLNMMDHNTSELILEEFVESCSKSLGVKTKLIEPCIDLLVRENLVQLFTSIIDGKSSLSFADSLSMGDSFWVEYTSKRTSELSKFQKLIDLLEIETDEEQNNYIRNYFL